MEEIKLKSTRKGEGFLPLPDGDNKRLIARMDIIGERMENEDIIIPKALRSAKTMGTLKNYDSMRTDKPGVCGENRIRWICTVGRLCG